MRIQSAGVLYQYLVSTVQIIKDRQKDIELILLRPIKHEGRIRTKNNLLPPLVNFWFIVYDMLLLVFKEFGEEEGDGGDEVE